MRSKLAKFLRAHFAKRMKERLPGFQEIPEAIVPPGCRVFGLQPSTEVSFFIDLVVFPKEDRFTLEGAWTRNGRFPAYAGVSYPRDIPDPHLVIKKDPERDGDFRFRLAHLWQAREHTWNVVHPDLEFTTMQSDDYILRGTIPESMSLTTVTPRIPQLVDDAIDHIERHALPYFDEIATTHNCPVSPLKLARRRPAT